MGHAADAGPHVVFAVAADVGWVVGAETGAGVG